MIPLALLFPLGHGGADHDGATEPVPGSLSDLWHMWPAEPVTWGLMLLTAVLYGAGVWRLWRAAGRGAGIRRWEAGAFAGGWLALFVALCSPLHPWGQALFAAHMTQHEVLMLIAAPLLVLGRPLEAWLWAVPRSWAGAAGALARAPAWERTWGLVTNPLVAWVLHAIVLWAWHVPALFQATLTSEAVHAAQHVSFLASALLFWWAVMNRTRGAMGLGLAVLYMFATAMHSGLLGALITFASRAWYPAYEGRTGPWGLTALEDQQLGGLIMWVPACLVYVVAGLALFAAWLRKSEGHPGRIDPTRPGAAVAASP